MRNILFEERNYIYIIIIPIGISFLALFISGTILLLNKNNDFIYFLLFTILFLLILLNFYQLKISVYPHKVSVAFGIGWFKKEILIRDININRLSIKKIPWYYGIGWRYDYKGNILISGQFGKGVVLKRVSKKDIIIVTKSINIFKNAIINAKKRK